MKVTIMSRWDAEFYCYNDHAEPTVMITISDTRMQYAAEPFCSEENKVLQILSLCFADADQPGPDIYGYDAKVEDLMRDEDAAQVAELLRTYPDTDVIVHCDAGISRSAGVGAAIVNYFTGDARRFFESGQYEPNMWCFSKVMTALVEA